MASKRKLARASLILIAACVGLFSILGLAGFIAFTTWYDPLKFAHGELQSETRLVIRLLEPKTLAQMYPRFVEAAELGGFLHTRGRLGSCTLEQRYSKPRDCKGSDWVETANNSAMNQRAVSFLFNFKFEGEFDVDKAIGVSTDFVLRKGSTESFTKEDWILFFDYKDNILPKVFPEADISIHKTRHPAVFTDDKILRQIQRETDFEIPEKYLPAPEN